MLEYGSRRGGSRRQATQFKFVAERQNVMERMEEQQTRARNGGEHDEQAILQYLVDEYHPSFRELRRVRNPMGTFTPVNERIMVSDRTTRMEINQYNRGQRLVQEIGAIKEDWKDVQGKMRKVWVYVLLKAGDATAARARNMRVIEGCQEKDKRLAERERNPRKYAREADKVRARVLAAIRRGARGGRGGAGVA